MTLSVARIRQCCRLMSGRGLGSSGSMTLTEETGVF